MAAMLMSLKKVFKYYQDEEVLNSVRIIMSFVKSVTLMSTILEHTHSKHFEDCDPSLLNL